MLHCNVLRCVVMSVAFVAPTMSAVAAQDANGRIESALLLRIGSNFLEAAQSAIGVRAVETAKRLIAEAEAASAPEAAFTKVKRQLDAVKGTANEAAGAKIETSARKRAAENYDRIAAMSVPEADQPRLEEYLWRSFSYGVEVEKRRKLMVELFDAAIAAKHDGRVQRIFERMQVIDATVLTPERKAKAEMIVARRDCLLIQAKDHMMRAYVALPQEWRPAIAYPVVVAVDGAGSNFKEACRAFRAARKDKEWIIIAPVTLSNANELEAAKYPDYDAATLEANIEKAVRFEFDAPGLRAILATVHERFGGETSFAMTGFSGGGLLTFWWLLHRPQDLWAAGLAGANYHPFVEENVVAPSDAELPIHLFVGEKDEHREMILGKYAPGIDGQTDQAKAMLEKAGFKKIERSLLPEVGHSSCATEVTAFFEKAHTRRR